ncbi:hypothetical protein PJJ81_13220, partial [Mycobacterium kansasii]
VSLRTICSGLCRFLVAMILLSLPAHSVGCKTLISHGPTDRGQASGSTIEVADHEVEAWAAEVAARHGFSDVSHTIEIFGNCADCRS